MGYYVYRFLNENDDILYVGKTRQLIKKRMRDHFGSQGHLSTECYSEVANVEYLKLGSRMEMDIVEIYYINKYKPLFNVHLKYEENLTVHLGEHVWERLDFKVWNKAEEDARKSELSEEFIRRISEIANRSNGQASERNKELTVSLLAPQSFEEYYDDDIPLEEMIYRFTIIFIATEKERVTEELRECFEIDEMITRIENEKRTAWDLWNQRLQQYMRGEISASQVDEGFRFFY